ncbi:MAG: hypothetical protein ABL949_08380 [Fimbriimonadaceae bacterium]
MIAAIVAGLLHGQTPVPRAAAFFGLVPGLKRSYMTTQDKSALETIEEVMPGRMIDQQGVVPVVTTSSGKKLDTNFFSYDDDGVYHYAIFDESKVLPLRAILKESNKETKWSWRFQDTGANVVMTCVSRPGAKRTIQGKEVETLTLEVSGTMGEDVLAVKLSQVAVYGYQVGLIEMKEIQQTKRTKTQREVKLVRIAGAGW